MVVAQALAEYGLLDQAAAGIEKLFNDGSIWIRDAGPGTWVAIVAVGLVLLWFLRR